MSDFFMCCRFRLAFKSMEIWHICYLVRMLQIFLLRLRHMITITLLRQRFLWI